MRGKKGKKKNLRRKFIKGPLTYIQLQKYRNVAIYQLINNKKHEIIGFQVFNIESTPFSIKDIGNQTITLPETQKYDFESAIYETYGDAIHVYTEFLKGTIEPVEAEIDKPMIATATKKVNPKLKW